MKEQIQIEAEEVKLISDILNQQIDTMLQQALEWENNSSMAAQQKKLIRQIQCLPKQSDGE